MGELNTSNQFIDFTKWLVKWTLLLVIFASAAFYAVIRYDGWQQWNKYEKHAEAITITAEVHPKCDVQFPIMLRIHNDSERIIESASIYLKARQKDYSDNLLDYSSTLFESTRIIHPGDAFRICWQAKLKAANYGYDPQTLLYEVESFRVVFKDES